MSAPIWSASIRKHALTQWLGVVSVVTHRHTQHENIMKSSVCAALLASVAGVAAARPQIVPSPAQPRLPAPNPPVRTKQCIVQTNGDGSDDSEHILSAFEDCNNGGHVVFSENATYTIGTAMDWTFLKSIDIGESSHPALPRLSTRTASPRTA